MNPKPLVLLTFATVVLAGGAFIVTHRPAQSTDGQAAATPAKLFDGLAGQLSSVTTIEMKDDKRTLTFRRANGQSPWTVADRFDYPAVDRVGNILVTLASMSILEEKTSKPERYSRIGVEDPSVAGSTGRLVTVKNAGGASLVSLIVGTTGEAGAPSAGADKSSLHVRRSGEAASYLVSGSLQPDTDPMSWIERTILQLERNRVKSVTVTRLDDPLFSAEDPAKTNVLDLFRDSEKDVNFKVKGLPPGRTLKYEGAGDQPATVLGYLYIEDVMPVEQVDFNTIEAAATGPVKPDPKSTPVRSSSRFVTFDGLVISVKTTKQGGKHWLSLSAAFDPAEAVPVPPAPEVKVGEKPPETPKRKSADEVKKEADELNAKVSKWAYAVPEYSMSQIATRLADLLADPPAKAEQPGPPTAIPNPPSEPVPGDGTLLVPDAPK